jgi:hypothetical protein
MRLAETPDVTGTVNPESLLSPLAPNEFFENYCLNSRLKRPMR